MVMHARKIPRLDDGYYERNQTHPFEENPSKSHTHYNNSRYSGGKDKHREDARANQRHHNAKPGSSTNSTGDVKRGNSSHSNHDRNHRDGRDRVQKERDHKAEQVRKTAVRVCADWSEHISSSGKRYYYNCKSEVSQWERPRDWDDALSSKVNKDGRDRPNSGSSHDAHKHSSGRRQPEHVKGTSAATALSRHPSDRGVASQNSSHGNTLPSSSSSLPSSSHDKHKQSHLHSASGGQRHGLSQHKTWQGHDQQHHKNQSPQFSRRDTRTDSERRRDGGTTPSTSTPGGTRTTNTTPGSMGGNGTYSAAADDSARYRDVDYRAIMGSHAVPDSQQSEDMDISPGSTPTDESMMERISFSALSPGSATSSSGQMSAATAGAIASLPHLIQQLSDKSPHKADNQQITQQAMETLQKLQQVVLAQQQQKLQTQLLKTLQEQLVQQTVSKAAISSAAIHTLQKLQHALLTQQQQRLINQLHVKEPRNGHDEGAVFVDPGASPPSPTESDGTPLGSPDPSGMATERSPRQPDRRRDSPTPSQGSSQGATVGTSNLSAAHRKGGDSADLTSSLSHYYNEKLLEHTSNWQGDTTERQANRYSEEAHVVGSLHCTQISADLKKARSLVRIAEIKSTLQEQRILFLRHSVRDLENMRIQNNFMSSDAT